MKGLGKGLDALLGGYEEPNETAVSTLSVYLIDNNSDQPRKKFDEAKLVELANSIAQHGIVQPIIVRKVGERYSIIVADRTRKLLERQIKDSADKQQIESELSVATHIQTSMLPRIFPAFPSQKEFDIYAIMNPAKEVGGDFYDFFMVDKDHLAAVVADVSGKGVPAALFMVIAKTLIKDHAQHGTSPDVVFTEVNRLLCETNDEGMFVTAWMGILELSTGHLAYVNAGHNPPLLRRADGKYDYLRTRSGLVLAGMEETRYRSCSLELSPGDALFIYTDGVTEATDASGQLYGEARLAAVLNANRDCAPEPLLSAVRADVEAFVGQAPQFDDITALSLCYYGQTPSL